MENWYVPITIIPGIGLLILSTSNLLIALSNEIKNLIQDSNNQRLIQRKLKQLKLLNGAMVFLYLSVACFMISGLISGLFRIVETKMNFSVYMAIIGIVSALLGLIALIVYSFKAVKIRQDQFQNLPNE
ncbi:DUF2721 domain-containing protein [Aquimarina gracilis]|uniref:DUF2721 domain-containing protein n=1 Tax=Aquimarina gracilis TaxID=874422 RepID=A0ABU5ZTX5_9FLAO|nr:DUF2721 domain-containing protein [Aquimarina gracilis]MEB3345474.1 DUF2721 domain-containing protein [Aquimarina gracilis]